MQSMPSWLLKLLMLVLRLPMSKQGLAKQARKPTGWYGKHIAQPMFLSGNAALNQLIFEQLQLSQHDSVLEVGFGPGALLGQIAESVNRPNQVFGLDFSETMLNEAACRNRFLLDQQLLSLQLGSTDLMPYADQQFSKICCANTLYFWQPPEPHLLEVLRCLKPGGKLVMGFRNDEQINAMDLDQQIFARYSCQQLEDLLKQVGFAKVEIIHQQALPIDSFVAVAKK